MHWFGFKLVPVLALRLRRRAGNMSAEPELRDFPDSASTARFSSESEGELEPIPAVTGQGQCMLLTVHQSITHRDNSPNPQSECFLDCWRKLENPKKKTKKNLTHMGRICTDYRKRQPVWYPPPHFGNHSFKSRWHNRHFTFSSLNLSDRMVEFKKNNCAEVTSKRLISISIDLVVKGL